MDNILRRVMLLAALVVLASCQAATVTPTIVPTVTPRSEAKADFSVGDCVRVTGNTYLRFGPGLDYPVNTNIPARPQPPIHIIELARSGLICANAGQCNPRDEGWWWPVQVAWADTGDVDQGWLSQDEIRAC